MSGWGSGTYIWWNIIQSWKEWNPTICDMGGTRGYYAKWNKSDRERQIPYDFTYMWNLKEKVNGQMKQK